MYKQLHKALRARRITQLQISDELGICPMAVSHRFTGRTPWRLNEMYAVIDLIREPYDKLHEYFPKDGKAAA